jgi:hypothetical protein
MYRGQQLQVPRVDLTLRRSGVGAKTTPAGRSAKDRNPPLNGHPLQPTPTTLYAPLLPLVPPTAKVTCGSLAGGEGLGDVA